MSEMTVFVINGDQKAIINSLKKVFNIEPVKTTTATIKNYHLTSSQIKIAEKFLSKNPSFQFNNLANCFYKRPSNVNLINYLADKGYSKQKRIVENKLKYYWTKV